MSHDVDRTVVISGAAGAIGAATVDAFLERGLAVIGIDRRPGRAASHARQHLLWRHDIVDDDVGAVDEAREQVTARGARADHQRTIRGGHPRKPLEPAAGGASRQLLLLSS